MSMRIARPAFTVAPMRAGMYAARDAMLANVGSAHAQQMRDTPSSKGVPATCTTPSAAASPRDPVVIGGVVLTLLAVALLASVVPARRATRIAPSAALRTE